MEYNEISFSTSEASFIIYYQLVDDLWHQYWGVQYSINKKGPVETNPLYETTLSDKEKELFVDVLNVPEKHLIKEIPFDLIEKELSFKPYLRNVKKLFKTIRSLKKPASFTYDVIEAKTIDEHSIYTIEIEELPAFVVKCRFKKNELVESNIYSRENKKIIHRFSPFIIFFYSIKLT